MATKYTVTRDILQDKIYNPETGVYEAAPTSDLYVRNSQLDLEYSPTTGKYELASSQEDDPENNIPLTSILPYREYTLLNLRNKKPYFLAYKDKIFSLCLSSLHNVTNCIYKIIPTPSNAKVEFLINDSIYTNAANEVSVYAGTMVEYVVSAPNYVTQRKSMVITENRTELISLTPYYTFTVVPTPSDAVVNFTVSGYTPVGNSITVPAGTFVTYSVSKQWYISQTATVKVTSNTTVDIELDRPNYTLTINPTPSDAALTITADGYTSVGNSITVPAGTLVTYTLEKDKYTPITATVQVAEDTTLTPQLQYLGIWERVGEVTKLGASKSYRTAVQYSSYYGKYYVIDRGGFSRDKALYFSSDLLNWTYVDMDYWDGPDWANSGDETFGMLSTGQVAIVHAESERDSSTSKYNVVIQTALLNKDLTFTTPQTVYTGTQTEYYSENLWGGELANTQLCFYFIKPDDVVDSSTFLTLYTTNGTSWSTSTLLTSSDDSPQLTVLGSNGSYIANVLDTDNGYQLYKCTSATAKTAGNILWQGGNMTGDFGFYDGYAFVYIDMSKGTYYSTNGTSATKYNSTTYAETSSTLGQIYVNDATLGQIYLTYNTNGDFRVVSVNYNTLHGEIETDIDIYNILGVVDNYIYIMDKDYLYKAKYQDVINNLT